MTEEELIRKAQAGNTAAFGQLAQRYYPVVERFAYQPGNSPNEIEDITQEVFIRVYRFLDQFSKAKFSTWLYKITLNVTRDYSRKKSSDLRKVLKFKKEAQEFIPGAEGQLLRNEEDQNLHLCLQKLNQKYRIPIILYYFHERKYEEIAEIMGVSLSTVKTRLLRGKSLLKKALEELEEKEGQKNG
ncbi:sigma-70 family RNA polymerase sigma factor [Bacillus lacus]|uniref:RNA polymerase sigma factor n=1 Tax=Metabacillus lacus TaxID=1983721 RepID=A0A7X2M120_9BACI|nr:sigma-70 family RNA polymerase sigma factor [Metabacillus lacus]MRX73594.1 sigma-70 family RNA polymerase sigma factor [Metabacillus lacus]